MRSRHWSSPISSWAQMIFAAMFPRIVGRKPGMSPEIRPRATSTGRGSFLDYDYRGFDPDVFALSTDEIAFLDPQQRLVLEVAWEALEQAAIDPNTLRERPSASMSAASRPIIF